MSVAHYSKDKNKIYHGDNPYRLLQVALEDKIRFA